MTYTGEESRVERLTKYWLYHHRCTRNSGTSYYTAYLSQPCGVCGRPLLDEDDIKVKRKIGMHKACFACRICGAGIDEPTKLLWADQFTLPSSAPGGLYHWECVLDNHGDKAVKILVDAPLTIRERKRREKASKIRREGNGRFAEITVPRRGGGKGK